MKLSILVSTSPAMKLCHGILNRVRDHSPRMRALSLPFLPLSVWGPTGQSWLWCSPPGSISGESRASLENFPAPSDQILWVDPQWFLTFWLLPLFSSIWFRFSTLQLHWFQRFPYTLASTDLHTKELLGLKPSSVAYPLPSSAYFSHVIHPRSQSWGPGAGKSRPDRTCR